MYMSMGTHVGNSPNPGGLRATQTVARVPNLVNSRSISASVVPGGRPPEHRMIVEVLHRLQTALPWPVPLCLTDVHFVHHAAASKVTQATPLLARSSCCQRPTDQKCSVKIANHTICWTLPYLTYSIVRCDLLVICTCDGCMVAFTCVTLLTLKPGKIVLYMQTHLLPKICDLRCSAASAQLASNLRTS